MFYQPSLVDTMDSTARIAQSLKEDKEVEKTTLSETLNTSSSTFKREIKFISLFGDRGHRGPYSPYKLCNHNLYIGIIIFPHIDNPQSTGYN